jgi:uncharacterized protein YlxW (UPF0749 family)
MTEVSSSVFTEYAGLWALIGTLFSGVILAVVNKWLSRPKEDSEIAADLRAELRTENVTLKDSVKELTQDVSDLHDQIALLKTEVEVVRRMNRQMREEIIALGGVPPELPPIPEA